MAFQISPGINVSEIDLTTVVPATATTDAGFAGNFRWGPLNEPVLISNEDELARRFGKPDDSSAISFFLCANFLAYGNKLRVVRVAAESGLTPAKNATAESSTGSGLAGTGLLIKNDDHYENNFAAGQGNVGLWAGRHPGLLGNSLRVSLCPSATAFRAPLAGVSSTGTALSIASGFNARLEVGSIIINSAGIERRVVSVTSDTAAVIDSAFPADLVSESVDVKWQYADDVGIAPTTTQYASLVGGAGDEIHVVVVDEKGLFTGRPGEVLERHSFLSKAGDAKSPDGTSLYYAEAINKRSKYIRWMDHLPAGTNWGSNAAGTTFTAVLKPASYTLAGGADGSAVTDSDKIRGFDLFKNAEKIDVSLIICGEASTAVCTHVINNICEVRKDCLALISPEFDDVVDNVGNEADDIIQFRNTLPSSSYAVMDSGWKKQLDKYNDTDRYVPLCADIAGLMVRTDELLDPWYSPAGFNRGHIKNLLSLPFSPDKAERDDLYLKGINSVVDFDAQGKILFGDKTLLEKPSAFDRINVRRLFIVLEKSIARAARFSLFEFNDEITRAQFRNLVEPFLRDVQARRGIYQFRVVCDQSNNTPEVIDRNEFVGDIYIKPARSINFIQLNFVAVRTGVEFSEIVGRF